MVPKDTSCIASVKCWVAVVMIPEADVIPHKVKKKSQSTIYVANGLFMVPSMHHTVISLAVLKLSYSANYM